MFGTENARLMSKSAVFAVRTYASLVVGAHGAPRHMRLAASMNPDAHVHAAPSLRSKFWGYVVQHGIKPGILE